MAELKLGNIKPVGADNIVVEGKYVKGGYVVVADLTERDALKGTSGENIVNGSLCYCQADSKFYQYNGTSWVEANLGGGTTTIDLPISNGVASPSIQAFDGKVTDANAKYAIAIGTNDNTPIKGILGDVAANQITVNKPLADAVGSIAFGGGAETKSTGGQALGVLTTSGVKGYYWDEIDFTNKTITITSTRRASTYSKPTAASSLDWQVGDTISLVNDNQYAACAKITGISGNKITVDKLPFTSISYKSTLSAYAYVSPDDRTIFACYQKEEANITIDALDISMVNKRWYPRNGVVELGWAGTAFGVENLVTGSGALVGGFNNWQAGNFGVTFGRDNIGGYCGLTSGMQNESHGNHLGIIGRNIIGYGEYNLLSGRNITLNSPTLTDSSHNVIGGYNVTLAKAANSVIIGSSLSVTDSTSGSAIFGSTMSITKGNNLGIVGYDHKTEGGNCHFIAGRSNTNLGTSSASNTILCGAYGGTSKGNTVTGAISSLVAGSGNTLTAASDKEAIGGFIFGLSNTVTGSSQSIVGGNLNIVDNCVNAIISGKENTTTKVNSGLVTGYSNTVSGAAYTAVLGAQNTASANYVFMFGRRLKSNSAYQTVIGTNNAEVSNAALIVGNGGTDETSTPKNAFVVHKDGRATVGKDPTNSMDVATKSYVDSHSGGANEETVRNIVEDMLLNGEW